MTFLHSWLLLFVLLPLIWIGMGWPSARRRLSLFLKGMSLAAILLALAEPVTTLPERKIAEVVLVDTSASISAPDLARAAQIAQELERKAGSNWIRIVPFGNTVRGIRPVEEAGGLHFERTSTPSAAGTNLEAALTSSMAVVPGGYLPRLLLLSDGNENEGSVLRAMSQLAHLGVPVDTIPLSGKSSNELRLESVSLPQEAYSGEEIPIDLSLLSADAGHGTIDIYADGKALGHQLVELQAGVNAVRAKVRVKATGIVGIEGRVRNQNANEVTFERAVKLRRAHALYLSQDPPGSDTNLLAAIAQANIEVTREAGLLDKNMAAIQAVVLNNLDLNTLSAARKAKLENYVKNGGGLLLIGGERQVYKEDKEMDALDRVLPAKLSPPELPKGTSVALIIDKSSSMEGRKIELARLSAIGVVDHLRPADSIGVLIFDNSYQWAVPMRHAEDKSLIKRLISGITPDGGTQIAPALAEAYRKVVPSNATFKHIVLLTDGISEEGDSIDLAKEAAQNEVTISTVGLGQDVNRAYLEKIALTSGGRSYFLNEPNGLEQILLKDVEAYSGSTAVEKALTPIVAGKADVLENVGMEVAPPLRGYTRYKPKTGAETLLEIDKAKKDPLYVRWQYGLGRAAVFTSDAKSRWAEAWMSWPGFDKFWTNVARDLFMHNNPNEASVTFDAASSDLVVNYQPSADVPEPVMVPAIYALGPRGFQKTVVVKKAAGRRYVGRLHIGAATGLFRIRPAEESLAFPEIGLYREQAEFADYGVNENLLREISQATGGRFNPLLADVFDSAGKSTAVEWQLWPGFLALAIALTILELVARKWEGLVGRFGREAA